MVMNRILQQITDPDVYQVRLLPNGEYAAVSLDEGASPSCRVPCVPLLSCVLGEGLGVGVESGVHAAHAPSSSACLFVHLSAGRGAQLCVVRSRTV